MNHGNNNNKPPSGNGGPGFLGYLLAGAVGVIAGLVVKKIVDENKDEEKKLNEQRIMNEAPRNQAQQARTIQNSSNYSDQTSVSTDTDTNRFDLENCEDIVCPITYEIMEKPMISKVCGHSFEQKAIVEWLSNRDKCPKCNAPLNKFDLVENYSLKNTISYMKAQSLYVRNTNEGPR